MNTLDKLMVILEKEQTAIRNSLEGGVAGWDDYKFQTGRAFQIRFVLAVVIKLKAEEEDD